MTRFLDFVLDLQNETTFARQVHNVSRSDTISLWLKLGPTFVLCLKPIFLYFNEVA
jgi:hypothetical protein